MARIPVYKNYINGKWVASVSGKTFDSMNPHKKSEIVGRCQLSNKKDVDLAVKAAQRAFDGWRLTPAPKRGNLLRRVVRLLEEQKDMLGSLETREMGKVKAEANGDVQEAIDVGFYFAEEGRRLAGQTVPSELPNKNIRTVREPVGVFGLITPWNFPVAIPCWKLFPALVCGNTVVFKPSRDSAVSAIHLVQLFEAAGLPPGVLNLVMGSGEDVGMNIVKHSHVNGVSFTGSTAVGKMIGRYCGENLKPHSLEMGGKNPIIIMDDANLDLAVDGVIWAGFGTTGQRCTAGSRVIVHKKIHDEFVDLLVKRAKKLRLGSGLQKDVDVGPLVNESQYKKTQRYVQIGEKEGASLLCGGKPYKGKGLEEGFYFRPTIFSGVKLHMRIAQEEIFGPVIAIFKASDLTDAIKIANNTEYGLSSSIFTQDVNNANIAARDLQSGLVYINTSTIGAEIQTPFGGVKNTGNGHREAGGLGGALDTYTELKVVSTDFSGKLQKAQIEGAVLGQK